MFSSVLLKIDIQMGRNFKIRPWFFPQLERERFAIYADLLSKRFDRRRTWLRVKT